MKQLGQLLAFVVLVVLASAAYYFLGMVLQTLWEWFITPVFNIAAPSALAALGIYSIITLIRSKNAETPKKRTVKDDIKRIIEDHTYSMKLETLYKVSPHLKTAIEFLEKKEKESLKDQPFHVMVEAFEYNIGSVFGRASFYLIVGYVLHSLMVR